MTTSVRSAKRTLGRSLYSWLTKRWCMLKLRPSFVINRTVRWSVQQQCDSNSTNRRHMEVSTYLFFVSMAILFGNNFRSRHGYNYNASMVIVTTYFYLLVKLDSTNPGKTGKFWVWIKKIIEIGFICATFTNHATYLVSMACVWHRQLTGTYPHPFWAFCRFWFLSSP